MNTFSSIIALVSAALGFTLKSVMTAYVDQQKELELEAWKIKVNELEKRLSQFYWPIYLRLQRDNVVWKRLSDRGNEQDPDRQKLGQQIETDVLLPNHSEIVSIIENNRHLAGSDPILETQLLKYIRHVAVYKALRAAGIWKDPFQFDEPYPEGFFPIIEQQLKLLQKEYDQMLSKQGVR
jgi:hypothetical protein